jgi:hypothetical protein
VVFVNYLPDAAAYLRRRVIDALKRMDVTSYFAGWLLPDLIEQEALRASVLDASKRISGAQRTYQDVALLGYALNCGLLEPEEVERLREGLRWMTGRTTHVDGHLADFCTDAVSLLGIALGLRGLNDENAHTDWVLKTCAMPERGNSWQTSVIALAHEISGAPKAQISSNEIKLLAFSKGLIGDGPNAGEIEQIIEGLKATEVSLLADAEAAIRFAALKFIEKGAPRISINHATIADVVSVLKAVPSGLQRWTWEGSPKTSKSQARKWYVDHEYHVQNLVWFLLSPLFPDAKFEENKSAVGFVHPRLDIVLPSLRLIIEVKFWRHAVKADEMIREIAEDLSLYLTADAPYDSVVPFIWDEGSRTEEHAALISGMRAMKGVADAVVISKPARMNS